ncbi:MAG: hypothetical protein KUG81_02170 [Gammaproteobacteria bacterium]|nr:hypothetical protein [Gammaproteobacteria bacterium]
MFNKERVLKNYVTTVLGLLMIVASVTAVFMEKATTQEVSGWFAFGVSLLQVKDSVIGLPKK